MLQDTRIIFLLARKELISAGILPSTVHIKVQKAKGPIYVHFTKQFQPLDSVDEIPLRVKHLPLLSVQLNSKDLRSGIEKAQKKGKKTVLTNLLQRYIVHLRFLCSGTGFRSSAHATSWLFCTSHRGFEDFQSTGITPKQPGPSNEDMHRHS